MKKICSGTLVKGALFLLITFGGMIIFSACGGGGGGDGSGNPPAPVPATVSGQALLGPLSGAAVTVYAASDMSTSIYTTTAVASSDVATAGTFTIPEAILSNTVMYEVRVSGGNDIDENDDGVEDVPTPNLGTLRLLATGAALKQGAFKVNMLTELAYFQTAYDALTGASVQTLVNNMDRTARLLLSQSIDGDGDVDATDLMLWNPANTTHKAALRQGWDTLAPYIAAVRDGSGHAALSGIRLSGITDSLTSPGGNLAYQVALSADGNTALVTDWAEGGLQFYDVTDPFDADYVSTVVTGGSPHAVAVSGTYAYVADGTNGLLVIDIPGQAEVGAGLVIAGTSHGVAVSGTYAYVVYDITTPGDPCGLQVVDISSPPAVPISGATTFDGEGYDVAVQGDYAYVASGSAGLIVVDVADPDLPSKSGQYFSGGIGRGVALYLDGSDLYAIMADDTLGLQVIDVTVPTAPARTATLALPGTAMMDVAVSGNRAYVAGDYQGLLIVDISDPANPLLIGTVDTPDLAWGVAVSGSRAFVADYRRGLHVIDVTDAPPAAVDIEVGSVQLPGYAYSVLVSGNYAYVGDNASILQVVDVSDPTAPVIVGEESTPGHGYSVVVSGGLAYVADHLAGLRIVDISNPAFPSISGTDITAPPAPYSLDVSGGYAYMAQGIDGLRVIDVSNAGAPAYLRTIAFDGTHYTYDVKVVGTHLFVDRGVQGLEVYSLSAPGFPSLIAGPLPSGAFSPFFSHGLSVAGNYAYLTYNNGGLQIYDITDPAAPIEAGAVATPGNSERVAVSGRYAYLADSLGGVQVIDVSDPYAPVVACSIDTPGQALNVAVADGYLYVADREAGVRIYPAIP